MATDLEVRASAAVPQGAKNVGASADPLDGAQNVHVANTAAVVDKDLSFVGALLLNSSTAVQLSAETAPGYLSVTNLDVSTIFIGPSTVSTTGSAVGIAIPAGAGPFTLRVSNPSAWWAVGGAASNTVSAMVTR